MSADDADLSPIRMLTLVKNTILSAAYGPSDDVVAVRRFIGRAETIRRQTSKGKR